MVDGRRRIGKVDRLPPKLKSTVEQMLLTGTPYREIVAYLKDNGEIMSAMAVCTYAAKYKATVEMITIAQNNFSMLMDEMNKYPDLDISEALIRLASHHVINALTSLDENSLKDMPVDKLIKESNSLIRAVAYKQRIQVQNQDVLENGFDEMKSIVFETMAKEEPELYKRFNEFINNKKLGGLDLNP